VGFLREAFEKFGKDRGAAGVDFGQWGEEFIGHFVKECRGGSAACDLMSANLRKDPGVVRKTGLRQTWLPSMVVPMSTSSPYSGR